MSFAEVNALLDQRFRNFSPQSHLNPSNLQSMPFGGSAPQLSAEQGKPIAHGIENSLQASILGIHARPVFEIAGDLVGANMHKLSKVMTPGFDEVGEGLVFRKMRWPHNLLQPEIPGAGKTALKDLSFHQLINGLISKALTETPPDKLDQELASKLLFTQFLVAMSFNYTHRQVLDTCREIGMAWQMKEFEWSNWPLIESRLKHIRARFQQTPQPHAVSGPKDPKPQGGGGNPNQPPKKQQQPQGDQSINGVPRHFMKDESICMKFNGKDGCPEKGPSHVNRYDKSTTPATLKHICAGCFKRNNTESAHSVYGCRSGPFAPLFR